MRRSAGLSEGELRRALRAGVPPSRIVVSGVGKTRAEMAFALQQDIRQINVESLPDREALSEVAGGLDRRAEIAIRVNPDVDARMHAKISTGRPVYKVGSDIPHARSTVAPDTEHAGSRPVPHSFHTSPQFSPIPRR